MESKMSVMYVLATIGALFGIAGFAAVVWALTRSKDRLQMATVCLFVCVIDYSLIAIQLYSQIKPVAILVGTYALAVYVVLAALSIFYKRWAWKAAIGAFVVHNLLTAVAAVVAMKFGNAGAVALGQWAFFGVIGLWASLHKGSREFAFVPNGSKA
jgi:hypothetical protein